MLLEDDLVIVYSWAERVKMTLNDVSVARFRQISELGARQAYLCEKAESNPNK